MSVATHQIHEHPAVVQYLDDVCAPVKAKSVHEVIRLEMVGHLEEIVEERMEQEGLGLDEAVAVALMQMGNPRIVGEGLHAAHRPRTEWGMIAILSVLIVMALISLFSLQSSYREMGSIAYKLIQGTLGITLMLIIYFVDYHKLLKWSWLLYWVTILLLTIAQLQNTGFNGAEQWVVIGNMSLNVYSMSPYLFLIAFAGMLHLESRRPKPRSECARLLIHARDVVVYITLPLYFYAIAPAMAQFVVFGAGLAIMLLFRRCFKQLLIVGAGLASSIGVIVLLVDSHKYMHIWDRLFGMLSQNSYGYYASQQMLDAIRSAGMWGHGFGSHTGDIPFAYSELLFAYLVYRLGFVFGTGIVVLGVLMTFRMIKVGMRLKDAYASKLVIAVTAVLAMRLVWNILMSLGLLPILGMELPIILWSSTSIVEFAAIGLVLSAYRRKDMTRSIASSEPAL